MFLKQLLLLSFVPRTYHLQMCNLQHFGQKYINFVKPWQSHTTLRTVFPQSMQKIRKKETLCSTSVKVITNIYYVIVSVLWQLKYYREIKVSLFLPSFRSQVHRLPHLLRGVSRVQTTGHLSHEHRTLTGWNFLENTCLIYDLSH